MLGLGADVRRHVFGEQFFGVKAGVRANSFIFLHPLGREIFHLNFANSYAEMYIGQLP